MNKQVLYVLIVVAAVAALYYFEGVQALWGLVVLMGSGAFWIKVGVVLAGPLKLLLLGMIKFIFLGLGGTIAPVMTVNMIEKMYSGGVKLFASYLLSIDRITDQQHSIFLAACGPLFSVIEDKSQYLSRPEARRHLFLSIKKTIYSIPGALVALKDNIVEGVKSLPEQYQRLKALLGKKRGEFTEGL